MAVINTNAYSLNAQRNVAKNEMGLSSALERLSSGLRVNSAKDDAAGLAIGLNMDSYARTISSRIRISGDTISKNQIADGALQSLGDISLRAAELEAQKTNTALGTTEKGYIDKELVALTTAASGIVTNSKFNGTATVSLSFTSATIGTAAALTSIASARADAGAAINAAEFSIQADRSAYENQMAAKSRVMDADFAEETGRLARHQVLQQAGMAMISQANAVPQNVLALLR
jgi:flagellin